MHYNSGDYVYVTFFVHHNTLDDKTYFCSRWCKVLSYDHEMNTYKVITENGIIENSIKYTSIHQKRTLQQGKKIRIKKLENLKID